jgi:hypothetical protein
MLAVRTTARGAVLLINNGALGIVIVVVAFRSTTKIGNHDFDLSLSNIGM